MINLLLAVIVFLLWRILVAVKGPEIVYHRKKRISLMIEKIKERVKELIRKVKEHVANLIERVRAFVRKGR